MNIDFNKLIQNILAVLYRSQYGKHWTTYFIGDGIEDITSYRASDFILNKRRTFTSIIYEKDLKKVESAVNESLERKNNGGIEH